MRQPILSKHRLPSRYRYSIVGLWLVPIAVFVLAIGFGKGWTPSLFDLRFLIPLVLLALPAAYIWQEGVDVLPNGIRARVHVPRYYDYAVLNTWHYDGRTNQRLLTVWDVDSHKILESYAGHLSDFPALLRALEDNVPRRPWRL